MFKSFYDDEFYEAIKEKNYMALKSFTVSAIQNNPSFRPMKNQKISEAEIIIKKLEKEVPEIFEEYEIQAGEKPFNASEEETWDNEYFIRQTSLLKMRNFSKTRLSNIRKIGEKISNESKESQSVNFTKPQDQKRMSEKASNSLPIPVLVAGGVFLLLMILVVILIKR